MIVGVTGYLAAGKDTFADYLVDNFKFEHHSLSDIIRADLRKTGKEVTRENLTKIGSVLRENLGAGILSERVLQKIGNKEKVVVSSIGTVGEIKELQKRKDFVLVFIDAPQKTRFDRIVARNREKDPQTFEEFKEQERKESKGGGKSFREFENTKKMAQVVLRNDNTFEAFYQKIEKFVEDWSSKLRFVRPSWDAYFLEVVSSVARRATCDRGRTASVIVKDKRILTTGYVGSPQGLPHCDEAGHLMKTVHHEDGRVSQHCVRTLHGEMNAILQAAKYGIPIGGATLYTKLAPCPNCAMLIINAGIKRVVASVGYHGAVETPKLLKKAGIQLVVLDNKIVKYAKQ